MTESDQTTNPTGKQAKGLLSSIYGKIGQIILSHSGFHTPWADHRFEDIRKEYEKAGIETITLVNRNDQVPLIPVPDHIDMENPVLLDMLARGRSREISTKLNLARWNEDFDAIRSLGLQFAQSQWVQDAFCVQHFDKEYNILLQPIYSRRITDQFISTELTLERRLNLLLRPTDLQLEGGNILVGDNYALIGLNTLAINWIELLKSDMAKANSHESMQRYEDEEFLTLHLHALREKFKTELGVEEIIWIGFPGPRMDLFGKQKYITLQPVYHLDLFLMLGGKSEAGEEIIYLADPAAGKLIAENATNQDIVSGLVWDGIAVSDDLVSLYFAEVESFFRKYNSENGDRRSFKVIRLPILIEDGIAYSFNNSVVEDYDGRKRAFLPNYVDNSTETAKSSRRSRLMNDKMEALQTEVGSILRNNGFTDLFWTGAGIHLQSFAARKGTLRCVSKVLRRT